jgi:hypothetical protein
MKKTILSVIFSVIVFTSNAQTVTVSGFGTIEKFGNVDTKNDFNKVLSDTLWVTSEDSPYGYKYIINFDESTCTLYDGNGEFTISVNFKIIDKRSNRDFQIEFVDTQFEDRYGIVVRGDTAAYFHYNGISVHLTIFEAMYIF